MPANQVALLLAMMLTLNPLAALASEHPIAPRFDGIAESGVSVSVGRIADLIWVPLVVDGVAVPEGSNVWLKAGRAATGSLGRPTLMPG